MIEIVNQVLTVTSLVSFGAYVVIIDFKANKKLKEGRYDDIN